MTFTVRSHLKPFQAYVAAASMLICTACTVGPNYQKPGVETPSKYGEAPPSEWKRALPRDTEPKGPWWSVYHDPELSALASQVAISNQNVAEAEAAFREATAAVAVERSNLFPTITASPAYTRQQSASQGAGGYGGGSSFSSGSSNRGSYNSYSFPASLSYLVDVWGSVRRSLEENKASAQASYADLANAELSYQGELAQDYFTLRGQEAQEHLFQETVENYQHNLDLTENRFKSGVDSNADVAQAKSQLDSAKTQLIDAGVTRATSEHAIAVLAGHPPAFLHIPHTSEKYVLPEPPPTPAGIPSSLLERRPDIAAAERMMASANAAIGVQEAAYYPQITIGANASFDSLKLDELFSGPSLAWSLGPTVAQTIYNGGRFSALVAQARATYDASVATYRQTVLTAFQQVEDALATLRILDQELKAAREEVVAAQDSETISLNQYKAGTLDYLQVITTQNTLLSAQDTVVQLQTRRLIASVQLVEALGGGWDSRSMPGMDEIEKAADTRSKDVLTKPPKQATTVP